MLVWCRVGGEQIGDVRFGVVVQARDEGVDIGVRGNLSRVDVELPTRVLIISLTRGSFIARKAAEAGAKGFLAKDDLATYLLPAIEAVHRGELFFME